MSISYNKNLLKRLTNLGLTLSLFMTMTACSFTKKSINNRSPVSKDYASSNLIEIEIDEPDMTVPKKPNNIYEDEQTEPIENIKGIETHLPTYVDEIPTFYKEQLLKSGYSYYTPLSSIEILELEVQNFDLSWLGACPFIHALKLNFKENITPQNMQIPVSLNYLKALTISATTTVFYTNRSMWETDGRNLNGGLFQNISHSGYDINLGYYHTKIENIELSSALHSLTSSMPNVEELHIISFPYTKETDASWITNFPHLKDFTLRPYFKDDWDLNRQLPDILSSLKELETLTIRTNAYMMSDADYMFIKDTLCHLPIETILYRGVYNDNSFNYEKKDNTTRLKIGVGEQIDFSDPPMVDYIDFSGSGIYYAAIYLDETKLAHLQSLGIKVNFGNHSEEDFKLISTELSNIQKSLKISPESSDKTKLDLILFYIFTNYCYGRTDNAINIVETYYKDGELYGALKRRQIVCGNYASLLCALLNREGVESYYIRNSKHAWVLAQIDGTYCYIDPTALDSLYDSLRQSGYDEATSFIKITENKLYMLDPLIIEKRNNVLEHEEQYYDAKIPYWLPIYSIGKETIIENGKILVF